MSKTQKENPFQNPEKQDVSGYIREDGKVVQPYKRTVPNTTTSDNRHPRPKK